MSTQQNEINVGTPSPERLGSACCQHCGDETGFFIYGKNGTECYYWGIPKDIPGLHRCLKCGRPNTKSEARGARQEKTHE